MDSSLSLKLISAVQSGESFLAENPNWNSETLALMQDFFSSPFSLASPANGPAHVWVASSGTRAAAGDSVKLVGLSHEAMLVSAGAVNQHLRVTETDVWGLCLPLFHVGGLAILYRGFLSGAKVQEVAYAKNNLADFVRDLANVTLLSLVPTQVFDLVNAEVPAPKNLRAVLVGGASLDPELYLRARKLGWPLLPSFGMTEACSQVATASLDSLNEMRWPALEILPHFEARVDDQSRLLLRGPSLLTGYWQMQNGKKIWMAGPRVGVAEFYQTEDFVEISDRASEISAGAYDRVLKPLGRSSDFVKILGEAVSLVDLKATLKVFLSNAPIELLVEPNLRRGVSVSLVLAGTEAQEATVEKLNQWNLSHQPFERIQSLVVVADFPLNAMGKFEMQKVRGLEIKNLPLVLGESDR